jgi:dTDP-4-dehydrorhamnose reductase
MLGHQVLRTLSAAPNLEVQGTLRVAGNGIPAFDAEKFIECPSEHGFIRNYEFIVNCIGVIKPYCKDDDQLGSLRAIRVNGVFPRLLAEFLRSDDTRVIQIATDCVYSGKSGYYLEDAPHDAWDIYGKSKSLGEVVDEKFLHIRSSIIGREVSGRVSLLEWFLSQPARSEVTGFDHHLWNGVTTLQFAELCSAIIQNGTFDRLRRRSHCHHFIPNEVVTKYQLLEHFRAAFRTDVRVRRVLGGEFVNRTLASRHSELAEIFPNSSMAAEIRRLAK